MENYQNYSMDDIVFENRNKSYGAFVLRQITDRHATYGLLVTTGVAIILAFLAHSTSISQKEKQEEIIVETETTVVEMPQEKPKEIPKPKIAQAPATPPPPEINTQQFIKLTPAPDNTVPKENDEPPKQNDLLTTTVSDNTNKTPNKGGVDLPQDKDKNIGNENGGTVPKNTDPVNWVEVMPSFVGGQKALMEYLQTHLIADSRDIDISSSGRVVIRFYVDIDGTIKDAKIVKDEVGGRFAEQALTVVNKMPKWNPGKQGDKAVKVYYSLPIKYQIK